MFHILLFLLHRRFKEAYFNLIRSANRRRQTLLLLRAVAAGGCSLTAARCRFFHATRTEAITSNL